MGLKSFFSNLIGKNNNHSTYAKMLDGLIPVFSQFGHDIYASDVVQIAIDCIATEISKLQPRHIRTDANGMQTVPKSSINRLFKFAPNPLMTTRDFLEKIIWLLYMNYNCFIYPMYDLIPDGQGGFKKEYTAFYPLNPTTVTFLQDSANQIFIKMDFSGGDNFTLNYANVIHLRKKFSVNSIMGGGWNGQPDNAALLKVLQINDTVIQGLDKAIKTSLGVRGILKINTMLDDEKQQAERKRFEDAIASSQSGILPMDLKGEYIDLKPDPKIIDKDTMAFIQDKILNWYGVPLKILSGDYDDMAYEAFQEKTLNPIIVSLNQAFSVALFTQRELDFGNEIQFFQQDLNFLSIKAKLEVIKIAGEMGILSDNQKLMILGMPPIEGGERYTQSLNFVDKSLINEYQMKRAGAARIDTQND